MRPDLGFTPAEQVLLEIVPILVVCGVLFIIGMAIITYVNNRIQPVITRPARVVAKRITVSGGGEHFSVSARYYATFESDSGSREELEVSSREYGMLAEGDVGTLRSQGTWVKGFDRQSRDRSAGESGAGSG